MHATRAIGGVGVHHSLPSARVIILALLVAIAILGLSAAAVWAGPARLAQLPGAIVGDFRDLSVGLSMTAAHSIFTQSGDRVRFEGAVRGSWVSYTSDKPFSVGDTPAWQPPNLNGAYYMSRLVSPNVATEDEIRARGIVVTKFYGTRVPSVTVNANTGAGLVDYDFVRQVDLRPDGITFHCGAVGPEISRDFTIKATGEIWVALAAFPVGFAHTISPYANDPTGVMRSGLWITYQGNKLLSIYNKSGVVWSQ